MKIYHNPKCRKSRETLQLLADKGQNPEIILYLDQGFTKVELQEVLTMLNMQPLEIIRKGESLFKESFKGKDFSESEWLDILVNNPRLVERPIVIHDGKAEIGRPPKNVLKLF